VQRNHVPVAQDKGKEITKLATVMPGHWASAANNSSWSSHQWPSDGVRSYQLSDHIQRPTTRIESAWTSTTVTEWSLPSIRATVQAKILYAAPAWSGFSFNSFLRRCRKLGYRYSKGSMTFEDMCAEADEQLFSRLISLTILTTYSTDSYHHPPQHHNATILMNEWMKMRGF